VVVVVFGTAKPVGTPGRVTGGGGGGGTGGGGGGGALNNPKAITLLLFVGTNTLPAATVGGVEEEILYDDYGTVDDVKVPNKIELHRGTEKYVVSVTRVVINGTVGERVFDFPIKSQVKLPDLKALFKEIDDNQKAIDKIKENYAGSQSEEETEFEGDGRVKKREANEYTFFYLSGQEVTTRVKKDGKPLSAEEQKKENEKTQKRIEELQKRKVKKEAKEEKAKEEGKSDEKEEPGIEVFLRACQFVNPTELFELFAGLADYDTWFTALRREQSPTRANLQPVDNFRLPGGKELRKVSPLALWTNREVWAYLKLYDVPVLPL